MGVVNNPNNCNNECTNENTTKQNEKGGVRVRDGTINSKTNKEKKSNSVEKTSTKDLRSYLRVALKGKYETSNNYVYILDFDESKGLVQFEINNYSYDSYMESTYQTSFTISNEVDIFLGGDEPVEVVRKSVYTPVSSSADNASGVTLSSVAKTVKDTIKDTFKDLFSKQDPILKAFKQDAEGCYRVEKFNDEEMIAYEPMYSPPNVGDSDAQAMTEDTIKSMVDSANEGIEDGTLKSVLFHKVETDSFSFIKAFVNPWPSCLVGDQDVVKGQPVIVVKYHNKAAWDLRKAGVLKGPSIGCQCTGVVKVTEKEGV